MVNKLFKDTKGVSLSGWTEAGLGVLLILGCLAVIVVSMNHDYNKNFDPTFGIATNDTLNDMKSYQGTLGTGMEGDASTNQVNGINLVSSWGIIKAGLSIVFNFVTGNWISNFVGLMQLGSIGTLLALILRLLFVFSIGFVLIKILFKVKP
jgi:hypothetical protein